MKRLAHIQQAPLLMLLFLLAFILPAAAQDAAPPDTGIYVTTQDFVSLRVGPGTAFERITVVPPAITLPAIGRTAETRWVQVWFEGRRGWIAQRYLVWSGDIVSLPVDGIDPVPYVRLIGVLGRTTRATPIYAREVVASDQVGTIPANTIVELTARLGGDYGGERFIQYQIRHQGKLYWVGSWDIRIINGSFRSLLDTTYLYPYGRLVTQLGRDIRSSQRGLATIENIWITLGVGQSVACGRPLRYLSRDVTDADVNQEAIFRPAILALDTAIADINSAISLFADACSREGEFLTQTDVEAALAALDSGRRNLNLAQSLLNSLAPRDPLVGSLRNDG